jgi:hypothetical protein
MLGADAQGLTDTCPGVVKEEQQCVIAQARLCCPIGLRENPFDLLWLKILRHRNMSPFARNRQDAPILIRPRQIVLDQMLKETPDSGQADVPAGDHVGSLRLQV